MYNFTLRATYNAAMYVALSSKKGKAEHPCITQK